MILTLKNRPNVMSFIFKGRYPSFQFIYHTQLLKQQQHA